MIAPFARIGAILLALLALSVASAFVHLGAWATVLNLGISVAKASLIAWIFMRLRESPRLTWLFSGLGLYWLGILFVLSLSDYLTRASLAIPGK